MGGVSGGHLNPAVSLAMLITRKMPPVDFGVYVGAQLAGATLGGFFSRMVLPSTAADKFPALVCTNPGDGVSALSAMFIEIITTFALVFMVSTTAVDAGNGNLVARQPFAAIPIGFTVVMGIL